MEENNNDVNELENQVENIPEVVTENEVENNAEVVVESEVKNEVENNVEVVAESEVKNPVENKAEIKDEIRNVIREEIINEIKNEIVAENEMKNKARIENEQQSKKISRKDLRLNIETILAIALSIVPWFFTGDMVVYKIANSLYNDLRFTIFFKAMPITGLVLGILVITEVIFAKINKQKIGMAAKIIVSLLAIAFSAELISFVENGRFF